MTVKYDERIGVIMIDDSLSDVNIDIIKQVGRLFTEKIKLKDKEIDKLNKVISLLVGVK